MFQNLILQILIDTPRISVSDLSEKIKLSEKTTRIKVDQLDDYLRLNEWGMIEKIPSKGVILKIDESKKNAILSIVGSQENTIVLSDNVKNQVLFRLLTLKKDEYITQSVLADEVFVSLPTLRKKINELEHWLCKFDLSLHAVRNKGLKICGSEFSVRQAIKFFVLTNSYETLREELSHFTPGLNIDQVETIIKEAEANWKIQFSNESLNNILIMTCLSVYRKENVRSTFSDENIEIKSYSEYNFSESIYHLLKKKGFSQFTEDDTEILAFEILGSSKLVSEFSNKKEIYQTHKINLDEFVNNIILSISDVLNEDLSKDKILKNDLTDHLRSAIFRMKYGQPNKMDLIKQLKESYNRVYLSVWSTSQLFEEYYDIQVTDNELCYLVLYIESALLRIKNKVDGIYITNQGLSHARYVIELIKHNIPQINSIEIVRENELIPQSKKNKLLFSDVYHKDTDVLFISTIPTMKDLEKIRNYLSRISKKSKNQFHFTHSLQPLFDPTLFFMNLSITNKDSLLKIMTQRLEEMGSVTPVFFDSVIKRENKTSTCIGNKSAIPHGLMIEINEPRIAVATLQKPIRWFNDEMVEIIFLLATKMNSKVNIKRTKDFYTSLISFTENQNLVEEFKKKKTSIDGYNFLFS